MRVQMIVAAVLLSITIVSTADGRSACELLPAPLVSAITDHAVRIDPSPSRGPDAKRDVCTYVDDGPMFMLSVLSLESERSAQREFEREIERVFSKGAPRQPLRGLGVEALFQASEHAHCGTIVARYGSIVFVLGGDADQEMLVTLARSVIAQLDRPASG